MSHGTRLWCQNSKGSECLVPWYHDWGVEDKDESLGAQILDHLERSASLESYSLQLVSWANVQTQEITQVPLVVNPLYL